MTTLRNRIALAVLALVVAPGALSAQSSLAVVVDDQKIEEGVGGFVGPLLDDTSFGDSVTAVGDVDGNGSIDLAVGGRSHDNGRGAVWILFTDANGNVIGEQQISENVGGFGELPFGNTEFGGGVAALGDVDGDGVPDLAVASGLPEQVWALLLNTDGTVRETVDVPYADLIPGGGNTVSLGSAGDFDGNGTEDLVLGLPFGNGFGSGKVLLLLLDDDGSRLGSIDVPITPSLIFAGSDVACVGDLDGNGVTELAYVSLQQLRIAFLAADGSVLHTTLIASDVGGFEGGINPEAVTPMGDLDGDGVPDIAVSNGAGNSVWLLTLHADGTVRTQTRIAEGTGGFDATLEAFDRFGSALHLLGDLNGDGFAELAVGANGTSPDPLMFPGEGDGALWILSLQETWLDQGFALAGSGAAPLMVGEGSLAANSVVSLSVDGGVPSAPVLLVLGASAIDAPFKQGVLVPAPDIARVLSFNGAGELNLVGHWPAGVPAGFRVFLQSWHVDAGAPGGFAGSNAVLGQTP